MLSLGPRGVSKCKVLDFKYSGIRNGKTQLEIVRRKFTERNDRRLAVDRSIRGIGFQLIRGTTDVMRSDDRMDQIWLLLRIYIY